MASMSPEKSPSIESDEEHRMVFSGIEGFSEFAQFSFYF
jgi:hypothetical protein